MVFQCVICKTWKQKRSQVRKLSENLLKVAKLNIKDNSSKLACLECTLNVNNKTLESSETNNNQLHEELSESEEELSDENNNDFLNLNLNDHNHLDQLNSFCNSPVTSKKIRNKKYCGQKILVRKFLISLIRMMPKICFKILKIIFKKHQTNKNTCY